FGFVYLWYLMAVLVLEIWLDYRKEIVLTARSSNGFKQKLYWAMSLGVDDISEEALELDHKIGRILTIIGIPSAFLLHGYVGFIFGSLKANPWWSSPMMPVVFLFSAIVSGIAQVLILYMFISWIRQRAIDMPCLDKIGQFLFYAFIIDFGLEGMDLLHRIYEADESFKSLDFMVQSQLYTSQILIQIILGGLIPIGLLAMTQVMKLTDMARKRIYLVSAVLALIGIFAMRWNVVIGGQLFSKSFLGYTTYKMAFATREGMLPALVLMVMPLVILLGLMKLLPPWEDHPGTGAAPD
ncbi:MAG: polysulfide reductase NrfD, partial [Acidobacteria bacterium]|nr:polysulfide reductase NrfD [Acidobacteriota bacterium]